jgi:hypothetical protein
MELTGRQQRVKEAGEGFGKNSDVRVIISGESFAKHGIFEDRTDSYEVRYKYLPTHFILPYYFSPSLGFTPSMMVVLLKGFSLF